MREKIFSCANTVWTAAKNPVGSAIVGGLSGSAAAHVFSKSKRVRDLEQAQSDCKKLEDLNNQLLTRNDKLRDELRQTDRDACFVRSQLSDYKYLANTATTAYKNSWCFWRYSLGQSQASSITTEKSSTNASKSTK